MFQIHSDLKELLNSLCDPQHPALFTTYQNAYLSFRGMVADAVAYNAVYREWAKQYLLNVNDESGEVVKLHESNRELKSDIAALIKLIERTATKKYTQPSHLRVFYKLPGNQYICKIYASANMPITKLVGMLL